MTKQINLHLSPLQHQVIKEAAKSLGLSISGFLRMSAIKEAEKCLATGKQ